MTQRQRDNIPLAVAMTMIVTYFIVGLGSIIFAPNKASAQTPQVEAVPVAAPRAVAVEYCTIVGLTTAPSIMHRMPTPEGWIVWFHQDFGNAVVVKDPEHIWSRQ